MDTNTTDNQQQATQEDLEPTDKEMVVKVFSQGHTYYEGLAKTVSAQNQTGPFDVLYGHANFLSLISAGDVVLKTDENEIKKIPINRGIMHVNQGRVQVFLDV